MVKVGKITKVINVARTAFIKGIVDKKNIVMLLIIGFIVDNGVRAYIDNAVSVAQPVNIFEPFIMCCNNWYYMVPFMIGFLFVIVDTPRLDQGQIFLIYRAGKNGWLLGEIAAVAIQSIVYLTLLFAGTVAMSFKHAFVGNIWSFFTVDYDAKYKTLLGGSDLSVHKQVFKYYMPYTAFINTVILMFLCMLFLGMVLLFSSVVHKKIIGVVTNVVLLFFLIVFGDYHSPVMWISPYCHMVLAMHNNFVYRELSVSLLWSYLYFAVGLSTIYIISIRYLKNHNCI